MSGISKSTGTSCRLTVAQSEAGLGVEGHGHWGDGYVVHSQIVG